MIFFAVLVFARLRIFGIRRNFFVGIRFAEKLEKIPN
jgi:hypothetical protein